MIFRSSMIFDVPRCALFGRACFVLVPYEPEVFRLVSCLEGKDFDWRKIHG